MMAPTSIKIYVDICVLRKHSVSSKGFNLKLCQSKDDFQNAYNHIENAITELGVAMVTLQINLNGKLNGKDIQECFDDFAAFRIFLENESLINRYIYANNNDSP